MIGALELGGTKVVVGVGTGPADFVIGPRIPTTTPIETLGAAAQWIRAQGLRAEGPVSAVGVGSFGPINLKTGVMLPSTPKRAWAGFPVRRYLEDTLQVPVALDTDVNAAAGGEARWGAGQGCDPLLYLTIGTGVGGGFWVNGRPLHGPLHPEMGHIHLPRAPGSPPGVCAAHSSSWDCLEGLVSGPALQARFGHTLSPEAWDIAAMELGIGLASLVCVLMPARVILGGGVMHQPGLRAAAHRAMIQVLNGYLPAEIVAAPDYVCAPGLGDQAGVLGALSLAALINRSGLSGDR